MNITTEIESPLARAERLWADSFGDALADIPASTLQFLWFLVRNAEQVTLCGHTLEVGDVMHELVWRGMSRGADWRMLGRGVPFDVPE